MEDLIRSLKALSDETRLRILNILMVRESCVCEVVQALGISQPRASRNLKILHDAGFLKLRRERLWSLYSLPEQYTGGYRHHLVTTVTRVLNSSPITAGDRERLKQATRPGSS